MPLLLLVGIIFYFTFKGLWWIIKLPFLALFWLIVGIFTALSGLRSVLGAMFSGFFAFMADGDVSVKGAKLLVFSGVIGALLYACLRHA